MKEHLRQLLLLRNTPDLSLRRMVRAFIEEALRAARAEA
jgi:hypothetical protein